MKYKLGDVIFYYTPEDGQDNEYRGRVGDDDYRFSRQSLRLLGATPIDDKPEKIETPMFVAIGWNHADDVETLYKPSREMREWMQSVTNWINNHERERR